MSGENLVIKPFQRFRRPFLKATLAATRPSHLLQTRSAGLSKATLGSSHVPAMSLPFARRPYVFKGVDSHAVCLPLRPFKPFKPSRRPSAGLSKATVAARRPSHLFFTGVESLPFARRQTLQTLPSNPSAGLSKATLAASRPNLFLRAFKATARLLHGLSQRFKPFRRPFQGNSRSYTPQPSVFKGVQACRLPFKPFKPSRRPSAGLSKQLSQLHAPAICF